ncbi:tetratricopeptide repeat protein [Reticulibacter mediterranei]|uniref:Tetratricopeptide repeat protein n=1 Tax=Reticulibacter mediterranei TaxID=2778369 RepID=A0A8J3ID60_9CHLR|nr:tetratricopeptide repeat protein [Reticulibacter mediterranei]GHO90358.1 tetratricopeptide repeat protein [Reticulibacter mediterranei]
MRAFDGIHRNNQLRQERYRLNWRQQDLAEQLGTTVVTVKRWERGIQQPSAYFRMKLCTLFGKSAEELGLLNGISSPQANMQEHGSEIGPDRSSLRDAPGIWVIPYRRNPHFTGREELLDKLIQQLALAPSEPVTATRQAVLSQPQAIQGLGGIGKTQIALEYAYRSRQQGRYTHTFWINAANEEAIITGFQTVAAQLPGFAVKDEQKQDKLIAAILRWLEQCPHPWLLIVDNADDLSLIQHRLPTQGRGSILLTTRAHAVAALASAVEVDQMGLMEGTHFLLHRSQRLQASEEERNEASNIVIALDGFPLALDQAGAYLEETECSFGDYLRLYEQHRARLLARRGRQTTSYPDSVATTWDLSFQRVEQAHPAAAELLELCASLAPDHIPEELLTEAAAQWPPVLQEAVADRFTFNELIEALLAFSLVKRLAPERLLSVHRLVQAVQLDRMKVQVQRAWAQRVVHALHTLFPVDPKGEVTTWPLCLRYLEQVQACNNLIQQHSLQIPEAAELLNRAGVYLREHASYSLAEQLFRQALAIAQSFGPEHLLVAVSLNNLGLLYWEQGQYEQAEPSLQQALHIWEKILGPHHPEIALPLNNLGLLYSKQGQYEQAESLLQRALHIRELTLSLEHPLVATSLNNLAILFWQQGKYERVEPLLQRALHIWEQAFGAEQPQVAACLNNLGNLYCKQGQYEQAEPLLQRALHIWEQTLGVEHPQVALPLNNLGNIYRLQGKYEQAKPLYQQALHIWEQTLSPHHPEIAHCLNNLGILSREQGQYEQAKLLLQRALHIWEQQPLGSQHPEMAGPLENLGHLSVEQGRYEQAESYYQRALSIREQTFGLQHPRVAEPLNGLANLSREQGQYKQADVLYQRALSLRQQALGSEHPEVAETLQDLARLRQMLHQDAEACSLYQQALAIREQIMGVHHPKTCETRERLQAVLNTLGKTQEAVTLEEAPQDHVRGEREHSTPRQP